MPNNTRRSDHGYTLLEALVTLFIIAEILVAVLVLFDFNSRVGRAQAQVAELQQSVRVGQNSVIRLVRMAGRGGLSRGVLPGVVGERAPDVPGGLSISVQSNVAEDTEIAPGWADSPLVMPGSDVITVRGVFSTPIVFLPSGATNVQLISATEGRFTASSNWTPIGVVNNNPGGSSLEQDVTGLVEAITQNRPEAILLVSSADPSIIGLVELDPTQSVVSNAGTPTAEAVVTFRIGGGVHTTSYSGAVPFPVDFTTAFQVAVLEEYRIYVRMPEDGLDLTGVEGDPLNAGLGRRSPVLSMARVYPFTNTPHGDDTASLRLDVAENIYDLQVAMGIDLDADGVATEGGIAGLTLEDDEWLFNDSGDALDGDQQWNPPFLDPDDPGSGWNPDFTVPTLRFVRVSLLGLTDRPDLGYRAPTYTRLEDREYGETDVVNDPVLSSFRRRLLQTAIDLRGL